MSTRYICDHNGCERLASFRIIARPLLPAYMALPIPELDPNGVDTCDEHYEFTHVGKGGGAWWDDWSAPQTGGKRHREP